jgi:hypothetical protein
MKRASLWLGVVVLFVSPLRAEPPADKLVRETWDAVYLEGVKAGSVHATVREFERDGKKLLADVQAMRLSVKREGSVVELRIEAGTDETPEGKVVGVSMTQFAGSGKLTQTGRVEGDQLVIRSSAGGDVVKTPWDDSVLSLSRQDSLFQDRKVKPGDRFSYRSYELGLQAVTTVQVAVKDFEEVDVLEAKKGESGVGHVKRSLLRVGRFTLYRTTEAVAREEGAAPALLPDLLLNTLIPLNKPIDRPGEAKEIVYRVTLKGDDDPAEAFAQDDRQEAKNLKDGACELRVRAVRGPSAGAKGDPPGDEYLKSSYFLDSDSPKIKALAADVVGDETDPWRKALRVEKWVHGHMKASTDVSYVPASQTAADLRGDCRQHGMLAAALCRAAKVPARTALGLVYTRDPERGPVLAFHMWTEVWIKGQWLGIDAVWGEGGVGADHIKIADHAWGDAQPLAPLLTVTRVMGKMSAEVVSVK